MNSAPTIPPLRRVVVVSLIRDQDQGRNARLAAQAQRGNVLRIGLSESGYQIVASLAADALLAQRLAQLQPELIIIDSDAEEGAVLDTVLTATAGAACPVVLFTNDPATPGIDAAVAAGVAGYIVAGLQAERVKPVLDVALARFRREQTLLGELGESRQKLADRKVIERAKGVLMARHPLTEDQAYQKLRGMAMNKKLKLAEVAQRLLDVQDLLG